MKSRYKRGFAYTDCQTDDARLVVLNAMDAKARGADIRVRTKVTKAVREAGSWSITAEDDAGAATVVTARVLVNATGPWVNDTLELTHSEKPSGVRLVQGSHIVTKKLYDHDRAYIFQNADHRIVFAIPWQGEFTMIGTTDRDWKASPEKIEASEEEIAYLCAAVDEYFERSVTPADVVWAWSGVRALADDGASEAREATRDYVLSLDAPEGRGAAAVGLWRQDHHLSPAGGGGAEEAAPAPPPPPPSRAGLARRRYRVAIFRRTAWRCSSAGCWRSTRSCPRTTPGGWREAMARAPSRCWRARRE